MMDLLLWKSQVKANQKVKKGFGQFAGRCISKF